MHAAVELAHEVDAAAIVIPTSTGGTPRACAKYRPRRPLIVLAHQTGVAEQLALEWGVYATRMEHADTVDELIDSALEGARDFAELAPGAKVVITAGRAGIAGRHEPDHDPGGSRARSANPHLVRLLVFDDPQLRTATSGWSTTPTCTTPCARWHGRPTGATSATCRPRPGLPELLRAHGTVDAAPYVPPRAA